MDYKQTESRVGSVNVDVQKNMWYFVETATIKYKGSRKAGNNKRLMKEIKTTKELMTEIKIKLISK